MVARREGGFGGGGRRVSEARVRKRTKVALFIIICELGV